MTERNNATLSREPNGSPEAPSLTRQFCSFDGGIRAQGVLQRPDRYRFWDSIRFDEPAISRGAGLSYAAASFCESGRSVAHAGFNRILDFDSQNGIVEVEAGIPLYMLYDFLAPRGFYLPIQPGHGRITVGGCVAADVHGKNQARDGTFINQVAGLSLFHPDQGLIELSPGREPDLFRLTCGGYGLTGHILKVRLRAAPIPSQVVKMEAIKVDDPLMGQELMAQKAPEVGWAYSWHDFSAGPKGFGQGYVFLANFAPDDSEALQEPPAPAGPPPVLSATGRTKWRLPFLNRISTRLMNLAYRRRQESYGNSRRLKLGKALFPIHETQFYFMLFGRKGFHEYQVIMPPGRMGEYYDAVRDYLKRKPLAVTLASGKHFQGDPELLRFTGSGACFAFNVPRTAKAWDLLVFLDGLIVSLGGTPNLIKDSRLPAPVMEACYPQAQRFRERLRAFDPKRRFKSELSERLGL